MPSDLVVVMTSVLQFGETINWPFLRSAPPDSSILSPGNPATRAQARRLEEVLKAADISVKAYGKRDSNHSQLNNDLGKPDDPATIELYQFLDPLVAE